ncbi:MAG: AmiS/UreI family transporter [Actinomycetota bacterium]|nr:AmiS/UreI family transporter [Actinomycetota bacterium]
MSPLDEETDVLSVAVVFFTFALGAWVMGLYLVGVGAQPAEDGPDPIKMVGWIEVIVGLILTSQVFILVQQAGGDALILTLAGLVLLFAVFFTALGVALVTGSDLRPVGNLAVPVGILAALYVTFDLFNDTFLFQSSTIWWGVVFLLVAGFTYGKVSAKLLGYALILTAIWGFAPVVYLAFDQPIP